MCQFWANENPALLSLEFQAYMTSSGKCDLVLDLACEVTRPSMPVPRGLLFYILNLVNA